LLLVEAAEPVDICRERFAAVAGEVEGPRKPGGDAGKGGDVFGFVPDTTRAEDFLVFWGEVEE